jgi:hypothetical protein
MSIFSKLFRKQPIKIVLAEGVTYRRGDVVVLSFSERLPKRMRELVDEKLQYLHEKLGVEFVTVENCNVHRLSKSMNDGRESRNDGADCHDALKRIVEPEFSKPARKSTQGRGFRVPKSKY